MKIKLKKCVIFILALFLILPHISALASPNGEQTENGGDTSPEINWRLIYNEDFLTPPVEPAVWTVEDYQVQDDIYFGDKGYGIYELFNEKFGPLGVQKFNDDLLSFRAYRKSYQYGQRGWLTIESYGISDNIYSPEPSSYGMFTAGGGTGTLSCREHTDAVIIRSTRKLPDTYRLEITVTAIDVGGKRQIGGEDDPAHNKYSWMIDGRFNGYFQNDDTYLSAGPWRPGESISQYANANDQNGAYFLSIVDYPNPKPHSNIFIHHHRKVAMDTDNNLDYPNPPWSQVWNGSEFVDDGSRYISMLWMNGESRPTADLKREGKYLNYLQTGQKFYTYTPDGPKINTVQMVDKFIPGNEYKFAIERTPIYYKMSVTGVFKYGGATTYEHTKAHLPTPENQFTYTWHFNQNQSELGGNIPPNDERNFFGQQTQTWPLGANYPDYFFTGMPHINYYAGSISYSNIRLYCP